MRIRMHGNSDLTVENMSSPALEVTSDPGVHAHFNAMEMFGASFALCSASVLAAWAEEEELDPSDLAVRIRWTYSPQPFRVARFSIGIYWPSLPEEHQEAASEAVKACTIHHTFEHPPGIEVAHVDEIPEIHPETARESRAPSNAERHAHSHSHPVGDSEPSSHPPG